MLDADGNAVGFTHRERRELIGIALLTIVIWFAWAALFFVVVPSWAFHVVSFGLGALAAFAITATAWVILLARPNNASKLTADGYVLDRRGSVAA
jgi:hypothetical protein